MIPKSMDTRSTLDYCSKRLPERSSSLIPLSSDLLGFN